MDGLLDIIINRLLSGDKEQIIQAIGGLTEALKYPNTLQLLIEIIDGRYPPLKRKWAVVLLKKQFSNLKHWQVLPIESKDMIKARILQALLKEKEKSVRMAIAQLIGTLMRFKPNQNYSWNAELVRNISTFCASENADDNELGSSVFSILVDVVPDLLIKHMDIITKSFSKALMAASYRRNLATPVIAKMMISMSSLMGFVCNHKVTEKYLSDSIPFILKALNEFAVKSNLGRFRKMFEIMNSIGKYMPKLLSNQAKIVVDLMLSTAKDNIFSVAVRVQYIVYIGQTTHLTRKVIIEHNLFQDIISAIFTILSADNGNEDPNDFYPDGNNMNSTLAAARTINLLAHRIPTKIFLPPLLEFIEEALQDQNPVRRRGAFLCIAYIVEGCARNICLATMLSHVGNGIEDGDAMVRSSAFLALGNLCDYLNEPMKIHAKIVAPMLIDAIQYLVIDLKVGRVEQSHSKCLIYAFRKYCKTFQEEILTYLDIIMARLFETLDPKNLTDVRELALSVLSAIAFSAKERLDPYMHRLIGFLPNYLFKKCTKPVEKLRLQAIFTLASIIYVVGKANFLPMATDTINYCVLLLGDGQIDCQLRRSIYNLLAAFSKVVNENMAPYLPKIMDRIIYTLQSTQDGCIPEDSLDLEDLESVCENINLDEEYDHDDDDNIDDVQIKNGYIKEKEEAILTLKEFATNTGSAFAPYVQLCFENVYKIIDHPHQYIRKASIGAITEFIVLLKKLKNESVTRQACEIFMPKLVNITCTDENQIVVIHTIDSLGELITEVGKLTVPSKYVADLIFKCIEGVFSKKLACNFNECSGEDDEGFEDTKYDNLLATSASNLFIRFGHVVYPQVYENYFGRIYKVFINKLNHSKTFDSEIKRAFYYGVLSHCLISVGEGLKNYFDTLCPIFIDGMTDTSPKVREDSYFAIGELILFSKEKSYTSYPPILRELLNGILLQNTPEAMDNICSAFARMIITNHKIIPLHLVAPVFIRYLPLRNDTEETLIICKAIYILYKNARQYILVHIEKALRIVIQFWCKSDLPSNGSIGEFIKDIFKHYPTEFNVIINELSNE